MLPGLRRYRPGDETRIAPPSPERLKRLLWLLAWPERVHRYEVRGLEHIPRRGPALLASHHSWASFDMFLLGKRIFARDGRVPRGLTDHAVFAVPFVRDLFVSVGIVDGNPENGRRLLEDGQLAACMPGGGLEWSRSWRARRQLRWGQHRGYARLAVRAGVPVIPTACPAADELYWVLNDGWHTADRLRRFLSLPRILPLGFGLGLGPHPFPVKLTQYVGAPQWPREAGDDEERARELDMRVRRIVSGMLDLP